MRISPFLPLVLFLFLVLQSSVRYLPLPDLKLDAIWLGVLFLGFYVPVLPGGLVVFLLACVQEAVGSPVRGVLPLSYLTVYLFVRLTHQHLFFQRRTSQIVWVAVLSLAYRGIETGLLAWQGYGVPDEFVRMVAWAFLEGIASLALFPLFRLGAKAQETLTPTRRKRFTL